MRRRVVVFAIGNAEAAAEIDMADHVTIGAQRPHEIGQQRKRIVERLKLGDLAADMHVDAGNREAGQLCRAGVDLAGAADRNAELVLGLAGRDLGVGLRVDVGIDAHRDAGGATLARGDRRQQFQLGFGFDVDAENVFVERKREFVRGLADAGEHDLLRRDAGGPRALEFAAGHHVGAGAELGKRLDHRLVGIRLHGVADERLHVGEGLGEDLVMPPERRGRIAIERGADHSREIGEIDRLGVQDAVAIVEVVHGTLGAAQSMSQSIGVRRGSGCVDGGSASGEAGGAAPGATLCIGGGSGGRARGRVEPALASAAGKAERGDEGADDSDPDEARVGHGTQFGYS